MTLLLEVMNNAFATLAHIASNNEASTSVSDMKQVRAAVIEPRSSSTQAVITFSSRRVGEIASGAATRRAWKHSTPMAFRCQ